MIEELNRRSALTTAQREQFVRDGFLKLENAFSPEIAEQARAILWRDTGCNPEDRSTWIHPVIRLGDYGQEPFRQAVNTPVLHDAFDVLVGKGRWIARKSLGTFPIRFPHPDDPGDAGWHVDASYPPDPPTASFLEWRINVNSRERGLLMLFLFSEVGENDAPTRIRLGSHLAVARLLAPRGEDGMTMMELASALAENTGSLPEVLATGPAGTVYLCHPFLAHAAQPHRGKNPKFMAQPPLQIKTPFDFKMAISESPLVEKAIRLALS